MKKLKRISKLGLVLGAVFLLSFESMANDYHTVVKGETLSRIALEYFPGQRVYGYGGTLERILEDNIKITDADLIYPGQRILIRAGASQSNTYTETTTSYKSESVDPVPSSSDNYDSTAGASDSYQESPSYDDSSSRPQAYQPTEPSQGSYDSGDVSSSSQEEPQYDSSNQDAEVETDSVSDGDFDSGEVYGEGNEQNNYDNQEESKEDFGDLKSYDESDRSEYGSSDTEVDSDDLSRERDFSGASEESDRSYSSAGPMPWSVGLDFGGKYIMLDQKSGTLGDADVGLFNFNNLDLFVKYAWDDYMVGFYHNRFAIPYESGIGERSISISSYRLRFGYQNYFLGLSMREEGMFREVLNFTDGDTSQFIGLHVGYQMKWDWLKDNKSHIYAEGLLGLPFMANDGGKAKVSSASGIYAELGVTLDYLLYGSSNLALYAIWPTVLYYQTSSSEVEWTGTSGSMDRTNMTISTSLGLRLDF